MAGCARRVARTEEDTGRRQGTPSAAEPKTKTKTKGPAVPRATRQSMGGAYLSVLLNQEIPYLGATIDFPALQ